MGLFQTCPTRLRVLDPIGAGQFLQGLSVIANVVPSGRDVHSMFETSSPAPHGLWHQLRSTQASPGKNRVMHSGRHRKYVVTLRPHTAISAPVVFQYSIVLESLTWYSFINGRRLVLLQEDWRHAPSNSNNNSNNARTRLAQIRNDRKPHQIQKFRSPHNANNSIE